MASSSNPNGLTGAHSTSPLIYACIAHGSTPLVTSVPPSPYRVPPHLLQHSTHLSTLILPKIPHNAPTKLTYTYQEHFLSYISTPSTGAVPRGLTYLVISPSSSGRKIPFAFLLSVQREFEATFRGREGEIGRMDENGADAEFAEVLGREMAKFCAAGGDEGSARLGEYVVGIGGQGGPQGKDNVRRVQEEIESVRGIMTENIERVLERGERIDLLVDKTGRLNVGASEFRRRSRGLRRKMWWKNVKVMILVVFVVLLAGWLLYGIIIG